MNAEMSVRTDGRIGRSSFWDNICLTQQHSRMMLRRA
jgi:hypothetical protein